MKRYGRLRQNLADMHLGALRAFYSKNPDRLAQAAHSLRELMEKLPEYLDVPVKEAANLGEKVKELARSWKRVAKPLVDTEQSVWSGTIDAPLQTFLVQIEEFFAWQESNRQSRTQKKLKALRQLDPLGFPYIGPVSSSWVKQWTECHEYFELVSHHRHVPTDDEFASQVSTIEQFLLDRLRPRTFEDHTKLDELISEGEVRVSQELVKKVISAIKRTADYEYFFDQIRSPNWLPFLQQAGLFNSPPSPEPTVDGLYTFVPIWPASRYLVRMAASDPEQALKIIRGIPETANFRVLEDIADAACSIPAPAAKKLVPRMKQWVNISYLGLLPEKLGAFISHLAQGGQIQEAYALASTWLTSLAKSPASFDTLRYEQLLQKLLSVLPDREQRTLELLCRLLSTILASYNESAKGKEDYSYIWRPAIEDGAKQGLHDLRGALVSAVRDAAERIVRENKATVQDMVHLLEQHSWPIFHRIALYLLYVFADAARELVIERLTNREIFEASNFHHEYVRLARKCFADLPLESQETILNWGEEPSIPLFGERKAGEAISSRDLQGWRWEHFAAFSQAVPEELRSRYLWLNELEPSEEADFVVSSWIRGWSNPPSPLAIESLRSMSIEDIVTFLKEWQPSGGINDPSLESLGHALTRTIEAEPTPFAEGAEQFCGIHPIYVHAVLRGFAAAVGQHRSFPWQSVLKLCAWIVDQPETALGGPLDYASSDTTWTSCRLLIAVLLTSAFEQDQEIPFALRWGVWKVLKPLTSDPNPTPEYEASYYGPQRDPISLCRGTVRGEAMQTTILYALWVKRHLEQREGEHATLIQNFDVIPEVREVLQQHLDPARDPSLAIRSVYGQRLHQLAYLDAQWTAQWVATIFPREESLRHLHDAAWDAYLIFCPLSLQLFDMLRDDYRRAIAQIGTPSRQVKYFANPDEHLVEHLLILYWSGKLDLQDTLLAQFFEQAPGTLREFAITFVGQSLERTNEVDPQLLQRLQVLWEWRVENARIVASPHLYPAELSAFGWWFASGKFNDAWAIAQLQEVLKFSGNVTPDFLVAKRLAELATPLPGSAIRCLDFMVKGDKKGWNISGWLKYIRIILEAGLQSENGGVYKATVDLIHELGARGYREFRALL